MATYVYDVSGRKRRLPSTEERRAAGVMRKYQQLMNQASRDLYGVALEIAHQNLARQLDRDLRSLFANRGRR